jgi:hypothetical protein
MAVTDILKADVTDLLFRDVRKFSQSSGKTTSDLLKVDVTDILFRDVRNLTKPSGRGTKKGPAIDWLAGTESAVREKAAHEVSERLADALAREHDAGKRLWILLGCEDAISELLATIEAATETAELPLSPGAQQLALGADSLLKALGIAYGRLAEATDAQTGKSHLEDVIQPATIHALRILGRRQMLAYRAGVTASAASWKVLHDLYALARRDNFATVADGQSPVAHEYLTALMLAMVDPGRLTREQLAPVREFIAAKVPNVSLTDAPAYKGDGSASGMFWLLAGRGRNGHGLSRLPEDNTLPKEGYVIDCTEFIKALEQCIEDGSEEATLPADTLRLLRDTLVGTPAARRFPRTQFMPRADLVIGFKEVVGMFSGRGNGNAAADHNDPASGEWSIVNESPDGYGIKHVGTNQPRLEIGDLVVLRPREKNQPCVCLVRRISNAAGSFEIGLQLLCAQAAIVDMPSEDITAFGQQVILLPHLPGFGNAAGVIATTGTLKPHTVISHALDGARKQFKLGSRVSNSSAIEFHLLQAA